MQTNGFHKLVGRAQAGDPQALEELLVVVRPWLEQSARRYADPHRESASTSDLAQEAWLRAWQKLSQFQGADTDDETAARFRAWVNRMVERLGKNAVRHRTAQHRKPPGKLQRLDAPPPDTQDSGAKLDPATRQPTPSALVVADEQARRVRAALAKIADEADREILQLRFFDGLSLRQIAERMQWNHEKVRLRYHAALRLLEREIGEAT
jgi:RNA polymerase sigma factor (sigma-70 family)